MKIKYSPNGHRLYRIICRRCGKTRWVKSPNVKQVRYCVVCLYQARREYNSEYVRRWRQKKKSGRKIAIKGRKNKQRTK